MASASLTYHQCYNDQAAGRIYCSYEYTGYGATAVAAEANAATYNPGCGSAELIAGPEKLSDGQWYVEYSETCVFNIEGPKQ
jgi:hypothetical protein